MAEIEFPITNDELFSFLKENEYVEIEALNKANLVAQEQEISLYEALLKADVVSDENLGKVVAELLKVPYVNLHNEAIPESVLRLIPEEVARHQNILLFEQTNELFKVAVVKPQNTQPLVWLSQKLRKPIKVYFATPFDMRDALKKYRSELADSFQELLQNKPGTDGVAKEVPVVEMVETLLDYAYQNKTSDIHIEPRDTESIVRFRVDGILHDVLTFPHSLHDQVVTRIKVLARLRTDEHLSAQDGKFRVENNQDEDIDIRVSILPVVDGEKVVLRLLTSNFRQFGLTDLGMTDKDLAKVKESFSKPYGMILSTGPTGSGKTTSMYAILKILNIRERNIATIEDPVEYEIEGINQIQVNQKTNLTFAHGLRSILRQDPDVIYVGEIRDEETAEIAINSATTGHLVLSTLHTNNAAGALPRLMDMNIEPFLISSTVNTVVGQRLIRKICNSCRVSVTTTQEHLLQHLPVTMVEKFFGKNEEVRVYQGKGCPVCYKTGFQGRVGVFEILVMSQSIQKLIAEKASSDAIQVQAQSEGMTTLLEDGLRKVQQGITTIEEVLRATKE